MQILHTHIATLGAEWFVFKNLTEVEVMETLGFCYRDERTVWLVINGPTEMPMPTFDLEVIECDRDHAKFRSRDGHTVSYRFSSIRDICVLRKPKDEVVGDLTLKISGEQV